LYRKTLKKLASLSALGAGAVAVGDKAEASIIYTGPFDAKVGIAPGYGNNYTSPALPGGATINFHLSASTSPGGVKAVYVPVFGAGGPGALLFEDFFTNLFSITALKVVSQGAVWSSAPPVPGGSVLVAGRIYGGGTIPLKFGDSSFTAEYAMFQFSGDGPYPVYGWIELSLVVHEGLGPGRNGANGPNLDILGYAFDNTGAKIKAGQTKEPATPEPSTAAMASLGALALGAVGLRRWRAARKA
jgi:hypothetical protein